MLGKTPGSVLPGGKRPWKVALDFVQGLEINGFSTGLTSLQFANNLWVAGIVDDPPILDMVTWLHLNCDLGATRGLEKLGFQVKTFRGLHAAFLAVHNHLAEYLSASDKHILHFGVIFVEHLLCKVARWGLGPHHQVNSKIGSGTETWTQGENTSNYYAFPIPEVMNMECIKDAVEFANVSDILWPPEVILIFYSHSKSPTQLLQQQEPSQPNPMV